MGQKPKEPETKLVSHKRTRDAFLPWIRQTLQDTPGIPADHKKELAIHMGIKKGDFKWLGQDNPQDLPLYLFVDGDLPRAGLWARMPYLRVQLRGEGRPRAPCAWCGGHNSEYGYHLMRCANMPPRLRRRRDAVLTDIAEEVQTAREQRKKAAPPEEALSPTNLNRLFYLHWEGSSNWRKSRKHPRSDRGRQPSQAVLTKALWYLRDMINTYRLSTKAKGPGAANPVWELPVYNRETDLYADPGPWAPADNQPLPQAPIQIGDSLANLPTPPETEAFGLSPDRQ
jgi:hypothetical protein